MLTEQASASAVKAGAEERSIEHLAYSALRSAELDDAARARRVATTVAASNPGRDVMVLLGLALARSGDDSAASHIADQLKNKYPLDKTFQDCSVAPIYALIDLHQRAPAKAIDELKPALSCEMTDEMLEPVYVRGIVYLQLKQGEQAAAEFKKIVEHPGIVKIWITGSLAPLQLARAEALAGRREDALRHYEDFLATWKQADADLPIFTQAKAEYDKSK